jgi:hypothetical protein
MSTDGASHILHQHRAGWANGNPAATLTASDAGPGDELGVSVATSANAIVARALFGGNNQQGAAYVFRRSRSVCRRRSRASSPTSAWSQARPG